MNNDLNADRLVLYATFVLVLLLFLEQVKVIHLG